MPEFAASLPLAWPLFEGLGEREGAALCASGVVRLARRGEALFAEGDLVTHLYGVESGSIKIVKFGPNGRRELTLRVAGGGETIGNAEVLGGAERFEWSAVVLEDARVVAFPSDAVRSCLDVTPAVKLLARRELELARQTAYLVLYDVGARLAVHLLRETRVSAVYKLPANSELAALLGTVPELVSRKLGEFYRSGLIGLAKRELRVLDEAGLRRVAEG
ncbi:Crp/Fnr family transcriptional regulator [Deinococcus yavapaiensis]|uniref:CRP/FNR family transcriptional regulator n=1 Tax=Deinococcus yavapaiensis KR-236 TaxID=694435 RepID=A0A318SA65_9DEIO|nr:Crp/Fnr family transcriptional regulator [Deinococcus yavapaiensis]PYE55769.1 CRP/FNR family transcriptional regulator [Deinococcus yavapaiensis KR-236]